MLQRILAAQLKWSVQKQDLATTPAATHHCSPARQQQPLPKAAEPENTACFLNLLP
jgi:hypothetical protein